MTTAHPPKVETFDTDKGINTDPKGFDRAVDRWATLPPEASYGTSAGPPRGLYMARPADHPRFGYLESWLLPALDLRVSRFHFRNGSGHGPYPGQELYIDIALTETPLPGGRVWRTTDLYIDVVTYAGGRWEILDLEELGDALVAGHLSPEQTCRALTAAQKVVTGIVTAGSAEEFLSRQGYNLHWADPADVVPAPPEQRHDGTPGRNPL